MSDDIASKIHRWRDYWKAPRAWMQSAWMRVSEGAVNLVFDIDNQGGKVELLLEVENSSQVYSIPPVAGRQQARIVPFHPLAGRDFRFKLTACPPGDGLGFILYGYWTDPVNKTADSVNNTEGKVNPTADPVKQTFDLLQVELELDTQGAKVDVVVFNNYQGGPTTDSRDEIFRFSIKTNGKVELKLPLPLGTINPVIRVEPDPREAGPYSSTLVYNARFTSRVPFVPNVEE